MGELWKEIKKRIKSIMKEESYDNDGNILKIVEDGKVVFDKNKKQKGVIKNGRTRKER